MSVERVVIIPDIQSPFHNTKQTDALARFIHAIQPAALNCVGDEIDLPQVSRWHEGMAGEYAGTLQRDIDTTRQLMQSFRDAAPDVPFRVSRSNHGSRVGTYIRKNAPALDSLRELTIEKLLGYVEMGVTYHHEPVVIAPNTVMVHGDEKGISQDAGKTASKAVQAYGMNVVCGHTHRLGVMPTTTGHSGVWKTLFGVEAGHMMLPAKASYLGAKSGNWQAGFAVLYIDGKTVVPVTVPMKSDGSFIFEGRAWK